MKKWMAMLLAGCLAFQVWTGPGKAVYGAEAEAGTQASKRAEESVLDVEVRSSVLIPYQGDVTVQLDGGDGEAAHEVKKLKFNASEYSSKIARFTVPAGTYTVTVLADQFADYTQEVTAKEGWTTKIVVSSAKVETGNQTAPGWIRSGDVNRDRTVDQKDIDAIMGWMRSGSQEVSGDINGDKKTDLTDLQYAVQSMGESRESKTVRLGMVRSAQTAGQTTVEGSLDNFLNNAGAIGLKPQDPNTAISEENFAGLDFVLAEGDASVLLEGLVVAAPAAADADGIMFSEITNGEASVVYIDENGAEQTADYSLAETAAYAVQRSSAGVHVEPDGSLVLDFGGQIAVKRVTIKITGTRKTEPLVNIAKVEFVNRMEERIPAPTLNIPTLNLPVSEDKGLMVSWNEQTNVTGYEIFVSGPVKNQQEHETQIVRVSKTQHRISSINDKSLKNFEKYTLKVRSVNGDWSSPWSDPQVGEPKPGSRPAPPDFVKAEGNYRSVTVSWKDMDDSNGYMVYYKKKQEPDSAYRPVVEGFQQTTEGTGKLNGVGYVIGGLLDDTEYSVYVVGWNELGWSSPSLSAVAVTKSIVPPELPKYMLLNTSNGEGQKRAHITAATHGNHGGAKMIGSILDTDASSAWGLVDDNYGSYWMKSDWDDGVAYPANGKGFQITLDQEYKMNYITFAAADQKEGVKYSRVEYFNEAHPTEKQLVGSRVIEKTDDHNNPYYIIKFDEAVTANKVSICLGRDSSRQPMMVGEIHFHRYDSLEDDIMGLYVDEMHTTLREDVTAQTIAALEARLETPETVSGEKHPLYQELKLELQTAKEILEASLEPAYEVDWRITARKDGHLGFGGLNAWQPLGKAVYAGERLLVYVGHNTRRTGDAAELQLVFTQHHAEAASLARSVSLKIGRNEITVPQIASTDCERGGQLYVAYTGNNDADRYAVRISGGSSIPVLNVFGKTQDERMEAIGEYVAELETYVSGIEAQHNEKHDGTKNVDYEYSTANCILNATDIMMKDMMYSLPAAQIWAGIQNAPDRAVKLDNALKAMEKTMTLFYQHKGLSDESGTQRGKNALPSQHLNIRYMRMFAGAFMYAAGNHIGIEYGSSALSGPDDWSGFGWGIAHEIGHDINQGTYAVAEVTNNYFAMLLTGKQRFDYRNVYTKVTSGTVGRASNVFTQLALYWQLHLAFDDQLDDRHIYDNYNDQFENLFFARMDTYSRNPKAAPQEGLTLNGGSDQNLMRLACAAANKNILPFFERWGMRADEATAAYAAKYGEPDQKAIYYINDDARDYRVNHPDEAGTIKDQDAVTSASVSAESNRAEITITTDRAEDLILGYEISRSMISNGEKKTEVIGFVPIETAASTVFVDTVSAVNNRVMEYEVRAVDQYLNYSNLKSAGSVKIQTDGVWPKEGWTVETTMTSEDDIFIDVDEEDPDSGYHEQEPDSVEQKKVNSIERILDNDRTAAGTYRGTAEGSAVITVDMHKVQEATALKYQGDALSDVTVEVSEDGETWTAVKEHAACQGGAEETIWFDSVNEEDRDTWIGTYSARYVRLTLAVSGTVSIQEIEVCGPSGDNLEFMTAEDGQPAIGVLTEDYRYGEEAADVIPAGSLLFTGTYKGNPAYNVVLLYDTEGNVIGEKDGSVLAKQVILAKVPEHGNLGETSDGTWVYFVEPGQWSREQIQKLGGVRGELYRVDNALTLEGERIVSDTKVLSIPESLPDITLQGGQHEKMD